MKCLNELNAKHEFIKFEYQISKTNCIEKYIEKKTDRQTLLNINTKHTKSF